MALKLITGPTAEPIDRAAAKLHLKIEADQTDEDGLIDALIVAARQAAEHETGRALIEQTWELSLDGFPTAIQLPNPPLLSVDSITYVDASGTQQTLGPASILVDDRSEPARIMPAPGYSWPATRCQPNAVLVKFTAGYAVADPDLAAAKQWMLLQIGAMYENREAEAIGNFQPVVLGFTDRLLDRYRVY